MKILAIDPSGSFNEGKGQSGWVITDNNKVVSFGLLKAIDYNTKEEYWKAHTELINREVIADENIHVVLENYRLYATKANSQINSEMETVRLIGYIEMFLYELSVVPNFQLAAQVKGRFSDEILIRYKMITKDSNGRQYINGINVAGHVVDALRHACLFYNLEKRRK